MTIYTSGSQTFWIRLSILAKKFCGSKLHIFFLVGIIDKWGHSKRRDNVLLWRDRRDHVFSIGRQCFLWERQFIFKYKPDFGLIGCSSVSHSYGAVFFL